MSIKTMILEQSFRFEEELEHIIDFIALDSVAKALDFYDELINNSTFAHKT
ncbi:hypothetical protein NG783_04640 [Aliarcobacter cryaerophilus]|uniref:hypothetical protein n=1 Tax=Aliarcobacter cryaerophilus TaxID=28198 RepID=UPI003DA33678